MDNYKHLMSPYDLILYDQAARRQETVITLKDTDFVFNAVITDIEQKGTVNIRCNADGSGYITAETTIETGFWNEPTGTYVKKLSVLSSDSIFFLSDLRSATIL